MLDAFRHASISDSDLRRIHLASTSEFVPSMQILLSSLQVKHVLAKEGLLPCIPISGLMMEND